MQIASSYSARVLLLNAMLEQGMVMIHLDPRRPGVDVPARFARSKTLALNLSLRFRLPDLSIDESGVVATLSFPNIGNHRCVLPWSAIYGLTSQATSDGAMWLENLPWESRVELAQKAMVLAHQAREKGEQLSLLNEAEVEPEVEEPPPPPEPPPPSLRVIQGGRPEEPATPEEAPPPPPRKRTSHLKLLK